MDRELVERYLISRKLIADGAGVGALSEGQMRWIIDHVEKFHSLVAEFAADQPF